MFLCCLPAWVQAEHPIAHNHTRAHDLVGETVADRPSPYYRFETLHLDSSDGKRHYRVQLAIPENLTAASPILYMLDGNAAVATLTAADLRVLSERNSPVLVAVGYDVATRNDVVSRAFDYTPPVKGDGRVSVQPVVRGQLGGGAEIFFNLIEEQVKPLVRQRTQARGKTYLLGHSYGGLFAMYALFSRPGAFDHTIVGDPSAWWYHGALFKQWESFDKSLAEGLRIDILVGTKPRPANRPAPDDITLLSVDGREISPRSALAEMAAGLRHHGAEVTYETFPEFGHGDMIRVSLERALHRASAR